jgi:hypothetical protein
MAGQKGSDYTGARGIACRRNAEAGETLGVISKTIMKGVSSGSGNGVSEIIG